MPKDFLKHPMAQAIEYDDPAELAQVEARLRELPPLVTSFEIQRLRGLLADAEQGKRFVLQGGDCAETLAECRPDLISKKLKILLQMSLVLVHGTRKPVVRIGRFAGQYAKPRSRSTETRELDGKSVTLPSYYGDLINRSEFAAASRRFNPTLLLEGYKHAAMTLNFVRSLTRGGFADLHHPEWWDLSFVQGAHLSKEMRQEYEHISRQVTDAIAFMEALGEAPVADLGRVEFFASHEGLNLHYEAAQTRRVPRREGFYDLTTHLPWIGERTRAVDGAHVAFFRGIENPVGVKLGPTVDTDTLMQICDALNPRNESGKLMLIIRMGAGKVRDALPALVERVSKEGKRVLWVSDPMHGNTTTTAAGTKTRHFEDIVNELEGNMEVHEHLGTHFGGVHFEMTGEDVTECTGGADGITDDDLSRNYQTLCDPRLNYRQSLEIAFRIARRLRKLEQAAQTDAASVRAIG